MAPAAASRLNRCALISTFIDWLWGAPLWQASLVLLAENLLVFFGALTFGALVERFSGRARLGEDAPPVEPLERRLAFATIAVNTAVTIAGLLLWRQGYIVIRDGSWLRSAFDCALLLLAMDVAMYGLHRVAHHPLLFPWLHELHHRYDRPRPLTLFVLHPAETAGFGSLWLLLLLVYAPTWAGMSSYLALNVLFGTMGHLRVESLPRFFARVPGLKRIAGGAFHVGHHQRPAGNFGFYTSLWDELFGSAAQAKENPSLRS